MKYDESDYPEDSDSESEKPIGKDKKEKKNKSDDIDYLIDEWNKILTITGGKPIEYKKNVDKLRHNEHDKQNNYTNITVFNNELDVLEKFNNLIKLRNGNPIIFVFEKKLIDRSTIKISEKDMKTITEMNNFIVSLSLSSVNNKLLHYDEKNKLASSVQTSSVQTSVQRNNVFNRQRNNMQKRICKYGSECKKKLDLSHMQCFLH